MDRKQAKANVLRYIDDHKKEIVRWLADYIGQRSEFPNELNAQRWVRDQFKGMGTFDEIDFWAADRKGKRPNVVGIMSGRRPRVGKKLILNGHGDVVPVPEDQEERWSKPPWKPTIERGRIYGRGANDMKGGIASMVWAARAIHDVGLDLANDLIVEVVVGEEEGSGLGTRAAIKRGYRSPFAIVTESTSCEICPVSVGNFDYKLNVEGKDCCNFVRNMLLYPQKYGTPVGPDVGVDALEKTLKLITGFREAERQWNMRWRDRLTGAGAHGVGQFSIAVSIMKSGTFFSSVPGSCEIIGEVYYPSWVRGRMAMNEMKGIVKHVSATDDWLAKHPPKLTAPLSFHLKPLNISRNHEGCKTLANAYTQAALRNPTYSTYVTVCDTSWFVKNGIPAVVFGPGGYWMGTHGVDEYVPISDVIECCKTLVVMATDWCNICN
jgi:acetylornithine deacetylase/succinyl-diaminopimelate desuccinylase-like protein